MDYSIVIPVYNSENSLEELFRRIDQTMSTLQLSFEVIFVDDNSEDDSWEILLSIKEQYPTLIKLIRFSKNFGQHNTTMCGFKFATGDYIITIDDDLQQSPEDIKLLMDRMNSTGAELVYGIRKNKQKYHKQIATDLYKKTSKHVDGKYGEGSSFRLITASLVEKIMGERRRVIFIEEILHWYTDSIELVPVSYEMRKSGKSGYSPLVVFRMLVSNSVNFSDWPLRFMTYGGGTASVILFLMGIRFIIKKLIFDNAVPGFTALMVTILFSTSIILLCFGILGKYLRNIYIVLNQKPTYSIKETRL